MKFKFSMQKNAADSSGCDRMPDRMTEFPVLCLAVIGSFFLHIMGLL